MDPEESEDGIRNIHLRTHLLLPSRRASPVPASVKAYISTGEWKIQRSCYAFKNYSSPSLGQFLFAYVGAVLLAAMGDLEGSLQSLSTTRMKNALGGAASPIKTIVGFVIMIFILYLFATSGLIANSQIQTQLKNGAYYAGNFSAVVAILLALDFIGL